MPTRSDKPDDMNLNAHGGCIEWNKMKKSKNGRGALSITSMGLTCVVLASGAYAQDVPTPLMDGAYFAPMVSYVKGVDKSLIDDGIEAGLGFGVRDGVWALEINARYSKMSASGKGSGINEISATNPTYYGVDGSVLLFPFSGSPNTFGIVGIGGTAQKNYPTHPSRTDNIVNASAGIGQLFPLTVGQYQYAIRAQALYRFGNRDEERNVSQIDLDEPKKFGSIVASLGLQLPFGKLPPPAPAPAPVQMVPPVADADSDHDGVLDPADRCPGTSADTPVDQVGCVLPPPCRTPEPGERVSLAGCGTGDVVVLRGVNFGLDSSELDPNAKTLLDGVVEELKAYPQINVEIEGHTDSDGSEQHNLSLSDRRAHAVMDYFVDSGISSDRLAATGMGEGEPIESNDTVDGRALNRRVELKITRTDSPDGG